MMPIRIKLSSFRKTIPGQAETETMYMRAHLEKSKAMLNSTENNFSHQNICPPGISVSYFHLCFILLISKYFIFCYPSNGKNYKILGICNQYSEFL